MTTECTATKQGETNEWANAPGFAKRDQNHARGPHGGRHPFEPLAVLEDRLLWIAGRWVVGPPLGERVLAPCMQGAVMNLPAVSRRGRPRECHGNSAGLWGLDPDRYKLATGYALWKGDWVAHSWVVDRGRIIETTCRRELYFGLVLQDAVALDCWIANFLAHLHVAPLKMVADRGGWPLIAPHLPPNQVAPDVRAA